VSRHSGRTSNHSLRAECLLDETTLAPVGAVTDTAEERRAHAASRPGTWADAVTTRTVRSASTAIVLTSACECDRTAACDGAPKLFSCQYQTRTWPKCG
jgi:hypothetical protein